MTKILTCLLLGIIITSYGYANTITVTSTNNARAGSLRVAISNAVDGDTIRFNPNLIANGSDSIVLDSGIVFSKSITIIGLYNSSDTLFLSGGQNDQIFHVDSTNFLSLDSMVLINADTTAISINNVDSVVFNHSILKDNLGIGLLISTASKMVINDCIFKDNMGSGLFANLNINPNLENKMSFVLNSSFINNQNTGLNIYKTDSLAVTITNCLVQNNHGNYGGGISLYSDRINATISHCKIIDNSANYGGGLFLKSYHYVPNRTTYQYLTLTNTTINTNTAALQGGGIYLHFYDNLASITRNITITHSNISNNIITDSLGKGAGIYSAFTSNYDPIFGGTPNLNNTVNIEYCTITGNQSSYQGGAIYSETILPDSINSDNFNIKNSTIYNNNAPIGASIFIDSTRINPISQFNITSSIIAVNGDHSNIFNLQNPSINSGGYNIFSDTLLNGAIGTDLLNVDSTHINLASLSFNGGSTQTMIPITPSIAKNNGNPNDSTDAHNSPINGRRDIGAAEGCYSVGNDTITACTKYTWANDSTYYKSTVVKDTIVSSQGCDSIITLNLTIKEVNTTVDISNFTMTAGAINATFQWIDCISNNLISDSTYNSFTVSESGSYAVEVNQNGCVDTSSCTAFTNVGFFTEPLKEHLSIYPNPAKNRITISGISTPPNQLDIYDAVGRFIMSYRIEENNQNIDISNIPSGTYFYKTNEGLTGKILVK